MSEIYKKKIPLLITALALFVVLLEYFLTFPVLKTVGLELQNWAVLIVAFAIGLGGVNITRHHLLRITKKEEDWYLSIWLLFLLVLFVVTGIGFGQENTYFQWLYINVYGALSSTTYSVLALFITSSAFRAFRARNYDASVLLISGFLVLIGNTPASASVWVGFTIINEWIMNVPTAAATRVIVIGAALGMVTLALRIITGKETGFLGGGGEE